MPSITYVQHNGERSTLTLPEGWSLMQGALANGLDGIVGECGGSCTCGTCHCYINDPRLAAQPASDNEIAMLEFVVAERRPTSRLACQVKATAGLEGLVVELPEAQE